ncbi:MULTISPECIES: 50S ribosomal protein L10 [unclassified Psychrobacter]|uniref:50S ribosomal protein L10 n=1 Tax=unclassified Psychrobacter TaxID=196806 RepID=UPI0018F3A633|nr:MULTISPECIES: 50S ribosomal protein L10 [unclassified Psychrobacter]
MALTLEQKQQVVAEVSEVAANAYSAVAAEYHGISVAKLTELRVQAREKGVVLKVVKNTLAKRAFEGTKFECMSDSLTGPLLLAFSMEDLGSAARIVYEFSKDNKALETKAVSVGGELFGPQELERVSKLPTRDEALAILMATMKAPVTELARTLKEVPGKFVRTVAAVKDAKEAA